MKLPEIRIKQNILSQSSDTSDKLYSEVLKETIETLDRQLSEVPFLTQNTLTKDDYSGTHPGQ